MHTNNSLIIEMQKFVFDCISSILRWERLYCRKNQRETDPFVPKRTYFLTRNSFKSKAFPPFYLKENQERKWERFCETIFTNRRQCWKTWRGNVLDLKTFFLSKKNQNILKKLHSSENNTQIAVSIQYVCQNKNGWPFQLIWIFVEI